MRYVRKMLIYQLPRIEYFLSKVLGARVEIDIYLWENERDTHHGEDI